MERIKIGNIIKILLLFFPFCKKYKVNREEAQVSLISASSPLPKNLVNLNQKTLAFFIGLT